MACCNPWFYRDKKNLSRYALHNMPFNGYQIPCGYCLNCRVDKRNQWSDRAKFELCKRLTASFVTLTYDDINLMYKMVPDLADSRRSMLPTLDYKDVKLFINRLRTYIKRHSEFHGVLCQPDFSYIYVGEYGEHGQVFDRPHFHVLFFGLDFAFCKKMFEHEWNYGIIDVLPLLDGGISYVLKYMDKQDFGIVAEQKYDLHGLSRPKKSSSKSFGSELYFKNKEYAKNHNWTYKSGRADRPYPKYYREKFTGTDIVNISKTYDKTFSNRLTKIKMRKVYNLKDFSKQGVDNFKKRQNIMRERKLKQHLLNDGTGIIDFVDSNPFFYYSPDRKKIKQLSVKEQRILAQEYRDFIRDYTFSPFVESSKTYDNLIQFFDSCSAE